jgi:deoxyribodipyrimidine photo-lyase
MRHAPHESHERLLAEVDAGMLIGDEKPMREPERWRIELAARIAIPFWTVDADVVVPQKLIEKAQDGAYTIRPGLYRLLPEFHSATDDEAVRHFGRDAVSWLHSP